MHHIKWILIQKIRNNQFKLFNIMRQIFYTKWKTFENLHAHTVGSALIKWQFRCSLIKIGICLVSLPWISELTSYRSIFTTIKHNNDKMYWGRRGRMFSAFNVYIQESLFILVLKIILTVFSCNVNIYIYIYTIWRITPERDAIIHNWMKVSKVDHYSCSLSHKRF
jgi:glucan phosphoethanolaminetransferase (alkaline phosphatase superfamily)